MHKGEVPERNDFPLKKYVEVRSEYFRPIPLVKWPLYKLKARLRWLKKQRAGLRPGEQLDENTDKIRRFTKEIFRRYSAEHVERERKKRNAARRKARARVKQLAQWKKERDWFAKKKSFNKSLRGISTS